MKNTALTRKWMEALRSGNYKQAEGFLRTENGHCCLGVLCDISGTGVWAAVNYPKNGGITFVGKSGHGEDTSLPHYLSEEIGLIHEDEESLVEMNDFKDATFEEIADAIQLMILADTHEAALEAKGLAS